MRMYDQNRILEPEPLVVHARDNVITCLWGLEVPGSLASPQEIGRCHKLPLVVLEVIDHCHCHCSQVGDFSGDKVVVYIKDHNLADSVTVSCIMSDNESILVEIASVPLLLS